MTNTTKMFKDPYNHKTKKQKIIFQLLCMKQALSNFCYKTLRILKIYKYKPKKLEITDENLNVWTKPLDIDSVYDCFLWCKQRNFTIKGLANINTITDEQIENFIINSDESKITKVKDGLYKLRFQFENPTQAFLFKMAWNQ